METSSYFEFLCERTYYLTQKPQKSHKSLHKLYSFKITETIKSNFGGFLLSQN